MHYLLTIACVLLAAHVNGVHIFFDDEATYNPCSTDSGIYFYPHRTDIHKYYQCDESGIAYLRSCGDQLVWDARRTSCNWPTKGLHVPQRVITTTPSTTTTTPLAPVTPSTTTTTTTTETTTETTTTATDLPLISLCKPLNPCGDHGVCLESPVTVARLSRRFACICSENWFGRLCDKHIDSLTTPSSRMMDKDPFQTVFENINASALPQITEKDIKNIIFGLNYGNNLPVRIPLQNETIKLNTNEDVGI